jgi:hypothetical protein
MTACRVPASGAIELYFYGELTQSERDEFEQHLAICRRCRDGLEALGVIRAALAARPAVSAPPAGDWSGFMSRLGDTLKREGVPRRRASELRHSVAGYLAMTALLAIVTIGVVVVMRSRAATTTSSPTVTTAHAPGWARDDRAFAALSEEHFERSKLVVLGLATKDARTRSADWTYERQLATSLLSDTRMYRLAAEDRGLQMLAGVMRDLELVLLQASLTDETDPASLAQIQRLIRRRDLLEKMDVVTTAGL